MVDMTTTEDTMTTPTTKAYWTMDVPGITAGRAADFGRWVWTNYGPTSTEFASADYDLLCDVRGELVAAGYEPTTPITETTEYGTLVAYETGEPIRPASSAEQEASIAAGRKDGGAGVIRVCSTWDGKNYTERRCYVED